MITETSFSRLHFSVFLCRQYVHSVSNFCLKAEFRNEVFTQEALLNLMEINLPNNLRPVVKSMESLNYSRLNFL